MSDAHLENQPLPSPDRPERSVINRAGEAVDMEVLNSLEDAQAEGSDLVVELIDLYLIETARLMLAMQEAIDKKDQHSITRAAHSLRGSSSSLGILQMPLICGELERTEFNGKLPFASELLSSLQDEFTRVREMLLAERQRRLA